MKQIFPAILAAGLAVALPPGLSAQTTDSAPKTRPGAIIITNTPLNAENGKGKAGAPAPTLSAGLSDIVRMFQAGVEEPVVLAFVQSSTVAYHPSAKEVIYLRELGVPQAVIAALLRRGGELRDRAAELEDRIRSQPAPALPAPSSGPPSAAAPTVVQPVPVAYPEDVYPAYAGAYSTYVSYPWFSYSYGYPYWGYRSCYRPFAYSSGFCRPSFRAGFSPGIHAGFGLGIRAGFSPGIRAGVRASPWRGVAVGVGVGGGHRFAGGGHRR